jgi:hypothetical protein
MVGKKKPFLKKEHYLRAIFISILVYSAMFQSHSAKAKHSDVSISIEHIIPQLDGSRNSHEALIGLTFRNQTSSKLIIPLSVPTGKGYPYLKNPEDIEPVFSIAVNGNSQPFGSLCATTTCKWLNEQHETVEKIVCSTPGGRLILEPGQSATLEFVSLVPNKTGTYEVNVQFNNQKLWALTSGYNSRILNSTVAPFGRSVFLLDSATANVELKATSSTKLPPLEQ